MADELRLPKRKAEFLFNCIHSIFSKFGQAGSFGVAVTSINWLVLVLNGVLLRIVFRVFSGKLAVFGG